MSTHHFKQPRVLWIGSRSYTFQTHVTPNMRNLVYMIHCTHCNLCYMGETSHNLLTRLKQHLQNIQTHKADTPLVRHFPKYCCFQSQDFDLRNKSKLVHATEEKERNPVKSSSTLVQHKRKLHMNNKAFQLYFTLCLV